jgi:hypothetical protein
LNGNRQQRFKWACGLTCSFSFFKRRLGSLGKIPRSAMVLVILAHGMSLPMNLT